MTLTGTREAREAVTPSSTLNVPVIYGTIPTFLGAAPVTDLAGLKGLDAVVGGLPWEGSNTWGGYSGCEQTPKACRSASLRLGSGFLPEHRIDVMTNLAVGDLGDLPTFPNDTEKTFAGFEAAAAQVFASGAVPVFLGGDHSVTYPVLKALSAQRPGRAGLLHFDAHLDNADDFCGDKLARNTPLRRIAELPGMDPAKIVHFGIRGPRNSPSQLQYALDRGIPVITMAEVRREGFVNALARAQAIVSAGTDGYYVTVCSDAIDYAFNPGGPCDFGGLTSTDMLEALYALGQGPMLGLDLVEVYPRLDPREVSMHLIAWLAVYGLAGLAMRRSTGAGPKTVREIM
jgi:agmatinase